MAVFRILSTRIVTNAPQQYIPRAIQIRVSPPTKTPETPVFREFFHARKQVLALFLALLGQPAETVRIERSMRPAMSCFIWSVTWPYTSSVKAAVAWPKFPCTVLMSSPARIAATAQECRRSWKRASVHAAIQIRMSSPEGNHPVGWFSSFASADGNACFIEAGFYPALMLCLRRPHFFQQRKKWARPRDGDSASLPKILFTKRLHIWSKKVKNHY
mgnify:CR=1 FL=1